MELNQTKIELLIDIMQYASKNNYKFFITGNLIEVSKGSIVLIGTVENVYKNITNG